MGDVEYGEECWADAGQAIAVGTFKSGDFTQRGYSCAPNRFLVTKIIPSPLNGADQSGSGCRRGRSRRTINPRIFTGFL
jgi:hypothetical protein